MGSLLLGLLMLSGCLPEATPEPTPLPTATITVTPTTTATVIWFPATATWTPAPTIVLEPTPDLRPVFGEMIFSDAFTENDQWQVGRTAFGSMAYGREDLTLAVSQPKGNLLSLRKTPQLANFHAEIDVQPSLCRGADSYGLLFRASSSENFYRLLVNCSGQVRLDRVKDSRNTPLQDWTVSGQMQPGGMLATRLGVSAQGQELRIYINNVLQFTIKDPVFTSGMVGVFARASGDTPLTVSFTNLAVYNLLAQ
jgi:hypothetical protein